ncbi:hypothetical protein [Erythrobacter oryzae]|uniref:hypothetical protein n=1 Tax=Erythrobacter oryzae TaxID=3019556 RepID=UPI00255755C0|nr:hypothetical protein [Erythrobacter sp. COR-2]
MRRSRLLLPAALALAAAPAAAESELGFTHPTEICVEQRTDAELAGRFVDMILGETGFGEAREFPTKEFVAIGKDCTLEHGTPSSSAKVVGALVAAKASRDEAARRLAERGVDTAWLKGAVASVLPGSEGDAARASAATFALLRQAPPAGLALDLGDDNEESGLIDVLVHIYVSGVIELAKPRTQPAR